MRALAVVTWTLLGLGALPACGRRAPAHGPQPPPVRRSAHLLLRGAIIAGASAGAGASATPSDVELHDGRIVAIAPAGTLTPTGAELRDLTGRWLAPAFIDSHVHLAILPEVMTGELADRGVAAAVDLAAPLPYLDHHPSTPRLIPAGPQSTAPAGYPVNTWGADGYGLECGSAAEARASVNRLADHGAGLIKLPLTEAPTLPDATIAAVITQAHARKLRVAVHALSDPDAARAAAAGADLLAHTPVQPLADSTIAAWSARTVITTLGAFGGTAVTVGNLRRLRAAGATILYGTDLGNTQTAGIDPSELELLQQAGLDGAAILAAGTRSPAAYWGLDDLGTLAPGKAASLLVLEADPVLDPLTLARPVQVYLDGALR